MKKWLINNFLPMWAKETVLAENRLLRKKIARLEKQKYTPVAKDNDVPNKWISVNDRLPEYEEPVMGWDAEMRDMGIVNFIYGQFFDILDMSETNVTHWMPLPQPPKGE